MRVLKIVTLMLFVAALCVCTSALAQSDLGEVAKVKDYYADWLSSIPGVTDVSVGEPPGGAPEIELHADVVTDQMRQLPHELNGFPVRIIKNPINPDDPGAPTDEQATGDDAEAGTPAGEDSSAPTAGQTANTSAPAAGDAPPSSGEPFDPWLNPSPSGPKSVALPPGLR